ncbi:MAG: redoxin domain-containing protein [Phycisphaerales bacterium]|nr:redoxin domain-containing protein [Phycisphaerales bacterium]
MRSTILAISILAALAMAPVQDATPKLAVGSVAPSIDGLEFVQGEPSPSAKVRVVEFWATWCGPCRQSIPHLNELYQAQCGKGLDVIGVSDEARAKVEPFIRKLGAQMSYAVAIDPDKLINAAFMGASGQNGIPCAFVIGQDGKIVFIGHPMSDEFTRAVKLSLAGRYDPVLSAKAQPLLEAARRAIKLKNFQDGYRQYDEVIAMGPEVFTDVALERYRVIVNEEKNIAASKLYAQAMILAFVDAKDLSALSDLAITLSSDPRMRSYDNDLALTAAQVMLEASSKSDPSANSTLASVFYARGEFAKAVEAQKKAIRLAEPSQKASFKPTLDAYELALKRGVKGVLPATAMAPSAPSTTPATVPAHTP